MMDRLVCAHGGNLDPTLTHGKDAKAAKAETLKGWLCPRHLRGRLYSIMVHGDTEGAESVRRALSDWLRSMHMDSAGAAAELHRYIGYWQPYAMSHEELDQAEVRNAARVLAEAVSLRRTGRLTRIGQAIDDPRPK